MTRSDSTDATEADMFLTTPLGRVQLPEPQTGDVRVDHVLVTPGQDALRVQLIRSDPAGLVVVATTALDRAVAVRLLQAVAAALAEDRPPTGTLIVA
jgi:hypothetical protein